MSTSSRNNKWGHSAPHTRNPCMFTILTATGSDALLDIFSYLSKTDPLTKCTLWPGWHCLLHWFDKLICICLCFNKSISLSQQPWPFPFSWSQINTKRSEELYDQQCSCSTDFFLLGVRWFVTVTPLSFSRNTWPFQLLLNHFRAKIECFSVEETKSVKQQTVIFTFNTTQS